MLRTRHFGLAGLALVAGLTVGCATEHPDKVPTSASILTEGNGMISAVAPHDGTVYVYDTNDNRIAYTGAVMKGQMIKVDTDNHRITADGKTLTENLDTGDKHQIYFDENPSVDRTSVTTEVHREETTVEH